MDLGHRLSERREASRDTYMFALSNRGMHPGEMFDEVASEFKPSRICTVLVVLASSWGREEFPGDRSHRNIDIQYSIGTLKSPTDPGMMCVVHEYH